MGFEVSFEDTELRDGLGRIDKGKVKAMRATRSDFRSRNASAVEKGVQAHYANIAASRITHPAR